MGEVCGHGVGYFKLQFGDSHLAEDNPQASVVAIKVSIAVLLLAITSYLVLSPAVKCCAMLALQCAGLHAVL